MRLKPFLALALLPFLGLTAVRARAASVMAGEWEGSGYMYLREGSKDIHPCELTTLTVTDSGADLLLTDWGTCMVDWGLEPLAFVNGKVYHGSDVIGAYSSSEIRFEYRSAKTDLMYSVHLWMDGDTLVMDELFEVTGLWWSKGHYKHQRKAAREITRK